jgi:hypothetical protein
VFPFYFHQLQKERIEMRRKDDDLTSGVEPVLAPWEAETADLSVRRAHEKARAHVDAQWNMPEQLRSAMMAAEISFWHDGGTRPPVVQFDESDRHLAVPAGVDIVEFVHDCLIDYASQHVSCGGVSPEGFLWAVYAGKDVEYAATCPIDVANATLGEWTTITKKATAPHTGGRRDLRSIGRNSPCHCGSGKKYKKCCLRKDTPSHDNTANKHAFACRVIEALRAAGETCRLEFDPASFTIRRDGKQWCFLGHIFDEYVNTPDWAHQEVMGKIVDGLLSTPRHVPSSFDEVRCGLRPEVRGRAYFSESELFAEVVNDPLAARPYLPIGDHHAAGIVYDTPTALREITRRKLGEWGGTFEEAYEIALQNLRKLCVRPKFALQSSGLYVSTYKDYYDASRLLLPELFLELNLRGDPIVMVPTRDTLLVAGSEDTPGLIALADLAIQIDKPNYRSRIPLRFVEGAWTDFHVTKDHPTFSKFQAMRCETLSGGYSQLQRYVDLVHQKKGLDFHVATYDIISVEDDAACYSLCSWPEGHPCLLPRTDLVLLGEASLDAQAGLCTWTFEEIERKVQLGLPIVARWEAVEEVVGDSLVALEVYPPRFQADRFPSKEQLQVLRTQYNLVDQETRCIKFNIQ